jgi:hypothetical protein
VGGEQRLRLAPAILCTDAKYLRLRPLFVTLLVLFVVGVPVAITAGLVAWRRCSKTADADADDNPRRQRQLRKVEERFGALWETYTPRFWYDAHAAVYMSHLRAFVVPHARCRAAGCRFYEPLSLARRTVIIALLRFARRDWALVVIAWANCIHTALHVRFRVRRALRMLLAARLTADPRRLLALGSPTRSGSVLSTDAWRWARTLWRACSQPFWCVYACRRHRQLAICACLATCTPWPCVCMRRALLPVHSAVALALQKPLPIPSPCPHSSLAIAVHVRAQCLLPTVVLAFSSGHTRLPADASAVVAVCVLVPLVVVVSWRLYRAWRREGCRLLLWKVQIHLLGRSSVQLQAGRRGSSTASVDVPDIALSSLKAGADDHVHPHGDPDEAGSSSTDGLHVLATRAHTRTGAAVGTIAEGEGTGTVARRRSQAHGAGSSASRGRASLTAAEGPTLEGARLSEGPCLCQPRVHAS